MTTIHLIFNAHLDPIWLWPWQSGLDEALATCRSACARLDAHPDLVFTRGEAWVYEQIERVDPDLFDRIREHVDAGRWELVGGWYIQPDCNLPSGFGFEQQIELGRRYFLDRFGRFPRTAYNVDSFGHAATLPGYMQAAGQDRYVMMRPQEHELDLPYRLFRWRGYVDGPDVVTFRIAGSYCASGGVTLDHIRAALTALPEGIDQTMCFVGIGDHGGGPTERDIAFCRRHVDAIEGAKLVFSSVERFFDTIADQCDRLPVVTGELQMHAIGCYTVHRRVKCGVRRGEHMLAQAQIARDRDPHPDAETDTRLDQAWRYVCFHQFHDTLGGTCLPSAFEQVDDELAAARAVANQAMHYSLRRQMATLDDDPRQRIVAFNASDHPFGGYVEFEPWLDQRRWGACWRLLDEHGRAVPHQLLDCEAQAHGLARLLFRMDLDAEALRWLRIDTDAVDQSGPARRVIAERRRIGNDTGVTLDMTQGGTLRFDGAPPVSLGRVELFDDPSDTWSHGIDRYACDPIAVASWDTPEPLDTGPLMASLLQNGRIGHSRVRAEYRVYAECPFIELRLSVDWSEQFKVLKLALALPAAAVKRLDGISGGELERAGDGKERPLRDRTLLHLADGTLLGIVCPDVYALDGDAQRVRLTLLRSPAMAWHDPHPGASRRRVFADRGVHVFRFRFFVGAKVSSALLDGQALMLQRPLVLGDLTRGMAERGDRSG